MDFMNLPVFTALKNKMQWHQVRHGVLAENIANAATPGYLARDVKEMSDAELLAPRQSRSQGFSTFLTNASHIQGSIAPSNILSGVVSSDSFEITPEGNAVVLEEQMMELTGNQSAYQAATTLYTSNLGLLRTAMGGSGR